MGNVHMEATQINYREGNKKMSVAEAIKNAGNTGLAHTADIAPEFSATSAYNAGDLVYKDGTLYQFTANHAAGAWSTDDTQATTIDNELAELMSGLTNVAKVPTSSPESAITTVEGGANYTYTATSDGFLSVHAPLAEAAREFNVFLRDNDASKYGVSIYAKVPMYHGDALGGLFVKAGRTYYIDNVGSESVDVYLNT